MSILTLANAKERLRISHTRQDTILQFALDAAENWVQEYCHVYYNDAGASVTAFLDGGGLNLWPEKLPIVSVTSVYDSWSLSTFDNILNTDDRVYQNKAVKFTKGEQRHRLIYVPGYTALTLPAELKLATLDYVYRAYHAPGGQQSESESDRTTSWQPFMDADFVAAVKSFRRGMRGIG